MFFQGGIYLFQLVDWYIAIFAVPVFGFIECLIFGWIYGKFRFYDLFLFLYYTSFSQMLKQIRGGGGGGGGVKFAHLLNFS